MCLRSGRPKIGLLSMSTLAVAAVAQTCFSEQHHRSQPFCRSCSAEEPASSSSRTRLRPKKAGSKVSKKCIRCGGRLVVLSLWSCSLSGLPGLRDFPSHRAIGNPAPPAIVGIASPWSGPRPAASWPRGSTSLLGARIAEGTGNCKPCAWFWRPQGCANGAVRLLEQRKRKARRRRTEVTLDAIYAKECGHCHLCSAAELKARKKAGVTAFCGWKLSSSLESELKAKKSASQRLRAAAAAAQASCCHL